MSTSPPGSQTGPGHLCRLSHRLCGSDPLLVRRRLPGNPKNKSNKRARRLPPSTRFHNPIYNTRFMPSGSGFPLCGSSNFCLRLAFQPADLGFRFTRRR